MTKRHEYRFSIWFLKNLWVPQASSIGSAKIVGNHKTILWQEYRHFLWTFCSAEVRKNVFGLPKGFRKHFYLLKGSCKENKDETHSPRTEVANPGPASHFWPARTFRMDLEEFLIDPDRKFVM